jgi:hypothetical protein
MLTPTRRIIPAAIIEALPPHKFRKEEDAGFKETSLLD